MRYHIRKLDDCYQIVSDTGDIEIEISKRLPNAWYLVQACMSLLLVNTTAKPEVPTQ